MSPATFASQRFYKKPDEDEWHAYREDSMTALCGESQISYNVDNIADVMPDGQVLHEKCRKALSPETDTPETTTEAVVEAPKKKRSKKS